MPHPVPFRHYKVLAAILKATRLNHSQVAWRDFYKAFDYFDFNIQNKSGNKYRFVPPAHASNEAWPFGEKKFFQNKPANGQLSAGQILGLKKTFRDIYGWHRRTFVPTGGRDSRGL